MSETRSDPLDARELAIECARIADSKRAEEIVILDVEDLIAITSYFVVCSAKNRRQAKAIADEVKSRGRGLGARRLSSEGREEGSWILLDYGDVIVHIFLEEMRKYYDLELLWGDAPRIEWRPVVVKDTP